MSGPILLEGRNLVLREGTGIATYASVLARTIADLGHDIDVVFSSDVPLSRDDGAFNEIRLHDAAGRDGAPQGPFDRARRIFEYLHADPFRVSARPVGPSSASENGPFPSLAPFARQQAATRLFSRAQTHLMRYGRRLTVQPVRAPTLFHATHPTPIRVAGCPNLYTIHDLVPLRLPHATLDAKRAFAATVREIARTADRIVTVSEHSKRDIVELLGVSPDRVVNTYQATRRTRGRRAIDEEERARELAGFGLTPDGYFLFVGAIEPKKNVERLIDAYLASGCGRPLVILGRDGWSHGGVDRRLAALRDIEAARSIRTAQRSPYPRVLRLPYLPDALVLPLLEGASALLFPSLYEGFGLPVLEAMQVGTPVLAGDAAALPEIVGDAGLLVPPRNVSALAGAIRRLDGDAALRADLSARGPVRAAVFSAERYSDHIAALYQSVL